MGAHSGWHCHRPPHAPCHLFQVTSCARRWHGGVTVTPAPQVLPPAEVLPLQHRRVQPVPAGRRRQLPLQQTPEGDRPPDPPQPWGGGCGAGAMPRGRSGSPCHSHGAAIKPGVPSGDRARPSWVMVGGGCPAMPRGYNALFWAAGGGSRIGTPQQLSLPSPSVPAALGPSRVRQRLRGGGRGVRLWLAGGERGPGTVPGPCRVAGGVTAATVPAGVRQERGQLLQEVHADPRRHVQRRALLQRLQGGGKGVPEPVCRESGASVEPPGCPCRRLLTRRFRPRRSTSRVACPAGRR